MRGGFKPRATQCKSKEGDHNNIAGGGAEALDEIFRGTVKTGKGNRKN